MDSLLSGIIEANLLMKFSYHENSFVKDFERTFIWVNKPAICSIYIELPICTTKQQSLQHCQWREKLLRCFIKKRKLLYLLLNKLEKIFPASIFFALIETFNENTTFTVNRWLAETIFFAGSLLIIQASQYEQNGCRIF